MSVPARHDPGPLAAPDARTADLSELLGHVHHCWEAERRALARQLHDSLGSSLTALTMHLGLLTQKMPPEPALHDRIALMKQLLHTVIENNRQMQQQLWNDKLEFLGVRVALADLVGQFGSEHQVAAHCNLPERDLDCPRGHGLLLLRVLEEGLRNVAAHARASAVEVIVDDNEEQLMLTVRDDGMGLNGAVATAGKFGLRLLRERALQLGGSLTLSEHPPRGAVLMLVLPKPPGGA